MKELTEREEEVLQLLAEGYSQKEVAYKLYISYHTMVTHKNNIQRKLNAKSCFQLGVLAERYKLIKQKSYI